MHIRIFIFLSFICIACVLTVQSANSHIEDYRSKSPAEIVTAIKNDFVSKDRSHRDRAIIFLSSLISSAKTSQKDHATLLKLAGNKEIIYKASDIVADRIIGWYEERECGTERCMPQYYPLIYLLSVSKHKTAAVTLVMAQPLAGFDKYFRKSVCTNDMVLKYSLPKLKTIENKLCCFYPGKNPVADMLAIDFRLNTLRMYLEAARDNGAGYIYNNAKMKAFVSSCLQFGDEKKGRVIRSNAVELACIMIRAGRKEFLPVVKEIAESDPCYLYKAISMKSNSLPLYDLNIRYYPVRDKAKKELSLQK